MAEEETGRSIARILKTTAFCAEGFIECNLDVADRMIVPGRTEGDVG